MKTLMIEIDCGEVTCDACKKRLGDHCEVFGIALISAFTPKERGREYSEYTKKYWYYRTQECLAAQQPPRGD